MPMLTPLLLALLLPLRASGREVVEGGCPAAEAGTGGEVGGQPDEVTSLLALAHDVVRAGGGGGRASSEARSRTSEQIEFPPETEIAELPGFGVLADHALRMSSGYISVTPDGSRQLFYVFVESQSQPLSDPFLLWTNGGPGCSGLLGFMTEQGPLRPTSGKTLRMNPDAWTKSANMVFIEQPAGVGFSTLTKHIEYNDTIAAQDNWEFIKGFFELYPQLRPLDFWITSESYGGHYIPTLAQEILKNNVDGDVKFKGFIVGNPLISMPFTNWGMYSQWNAWSLLPKPKWDAFVENKCGLLWTNRMPVPGSPSDVVMTCYNILVDFWKQAKGLDPYALGFPVCSKQADQILNQTLPQILPALEARRKFDGYEPCLEDYMTEYFNDPEVQTVLRVQPFSPGHGKPRKWSDCDFIQYSSESFNANMVGTYKELFETSGLRMMIVSGNEDSVCATAGDQMWIWDMGYDITEEWAPWTYNGEVAGHTVKFTTASGGGFRYTTVQAAGHMIPTTQPERSYYLVSKFLAGEW